MEIWTEKYRPKKLADVKGQKGVIKILQSFIESNNMPHLLFAGPAGVGKTTTALCIANEFFGENWQSNLLELNASDERGIDVIRNKVKDFARTRTIGNFQFKLILLDEADALTREAQHALRRTMEKYTKTCRFILDCNYSSKIIEPIQSRCATFRFKHLGEKELYEYIGHISSEEGLKLDEKSIGALYKVSGGDARRAINLLQSCSVLSKKISEDDVFKASNFARPSEMKEVMAAAISGHFLDASKKMFDVMLEYGLSGIDVIKQISSFLWELDIPEEKKILLIDRIGEFEFRIVEGADPIIQLNAFLAQLSLLK